MLCLRGSWRPNRTATYWPPLLWPSAFLSRSPGCSTGGLGAQPLWVLVFSTASYLQLVWSPKPQSIFLCTELYNSSTSTQYLPITGHRNMHFRHLWNGMFDRHRAEITVIQFTGNSLPVHQFVTVLWDFNLVPYCQPSLPTPMEYALPPSLEWHVWPGRRSIYYRRGKVSYSKSVSVCSVILATWDRALSRIKVMTKLELIQKSNCIISFFIFMIRDI